MYYLFKCYSYICTSNNAKEKIEIMKTKNWKINIESATNLPLKHILVCNYDMGDFTEVVYHYIGYKNTEKRGIGQWNIKLK